MPHLHGVFWLNEKEIQSCRNSEGDYIDENVIELIDKWVSCTLDPQDEKVYNLVKEVNVHHHTKSCQKGKSIGCRFNFPRFPSNKTIIAHPISPDLSETEQKQKLKKSKEILKTVKTKLEEISNEEIEEIEDSLDLFLNALDITKEDYEEALGISEKGKVVILKRTLSERFVNNYNREFLLAWKANLDIQFCYDGYAVVTYITDYLTKADAGVTQALQKSLRGSKNCSDLERLNNVKRAYFTHRQVSAAEAVYRLNQGMHLSQSNVKTRFVATGFEENRSSFFQKIKDTNDDEIENEGENDGDFDDNAKIDNNGNAKVFTLPGREGQFKKVQTIHRKYADRPDPLKNICLAQFATSYDFSAKPKEDIIFEDGASHIKGSLKFFGFDDRLPKFVQLKSGGYMKLRSSPFILRIHSSKKKQPDEGKYSELLLYFPWQSENELRKSFNLTYNDNYEIIKKNKQQIYPNSKMVDDMRDLLDNTNNVRPQHLLETLDAFGEQENLDNEDILESLDTSVLPEEDPVSVNVKPNGLLFKKIEIDEEDTMLQTARSLSFEQRIVFDQVIKFCKEVLRLSKGAPIKIFPPNVIVTGNLQTFRAIFF